jgi:hypothetical protein
MLISRHQNIAFIHVPKCGGMTVKHQFADLADTETRYDRTVVHPILGSIRLGHLPLWALRDHFPDAFSMPQTSRCFTLCQDPFDRFESALSKHLRQFQDQSINDLSQTPQPVQAEDCHFIPQSHFIMLDGVRIIADLYTLQHMRDLIRDLSAASGIAGAPDMQSNQTLAFRIKGSEKILRRISGTLRGFLPKSFHARIKKAAKSALTVGPNSHKGFARQETEIRAFIEQFYADDLILYRSALNNTIRQEA